MLISHVLRLKGHMSCMAHAFEVPQPSLPCFLRHLTRVNAVTGVRNFVQSRIKNTVAPPDSNPNWLDIPATPSVPPSALTATCTHSPRVFRTGSWAQRTADDHLALALGAFTAYN